MVGSISEFRHRFGSIENLTDIFEEDINIAATGVALRKELEKILLRRTYGDLAVNDLPSRTDIDVFCELSELQSIEYDYVQRRIFGYEKQILI